MNPDSVPELADQNTPPAWVALLLAELRAIKAALLAPAEAKAVDLPTAAQMLGISERSLARLLATNDGPPSLRIGDRRLFRVSSLKEWLEQRERVG
jgi:predicted DNA-binding transcriptional regulator AlpA